MSFNPLPKKATPGLGRQDSSGKALGQFLGRGLLPVKLGTGAATTCPCGECLGASGVGNSLEGTR